QIRLRPFMSQNVCPPERRERPGPEPNRREQLGAPATKIPVTERCQNQTITFALRNHPPSSDALVNDDWLAAAYDPGQSFLAREKAIVALLWIEKVYGTPVHAIVEKLRAATNLGLMGWMKASSPKATNFQANGKVAKQMIGRRLSQEE